MLRHACWIAAIAAVVLPAAGVADSFMVRSYEYDRGNLDIIDIGRSYADTEPVVINGYQYPNTAEYDLTFPVTGDYVIQARYAANDIRPVDFYLDDTLLGRGLKGTTGSWQASSAKWEEQARAHITAGKHTFKFVCPGGCIPHVVAFRFETAAPFPAGWKRRPKPVPEQPVVWSGQPEPGKLGYAAYVRADGFVDAPKDYDPTVPYQAIPAPNPRGERILEYLLINPGAYQIKAELDEEGPNTPQAFPAQGLDSRDTAAAMQPLQVRLSVQVGPDRVETETLGLDPDRIEAMLKHARKLAVCFSSGAIYRADGRNELRRYNGSAQMRAAGEIMKRLDTARALPEADPGRWKQLYDLYVAAWRLKHEVALQNPLLAFGKLLFVRRQTYDTSHIYTTYFDGSHRYGGNLAVLDGLRPDGVCRELPTGLPGPAIYRDPELSWDATKLLFAYKPDAATGNHIYEMDLGGVVGGASSPERSGRPERSRLEAAPTAPPVPAVRQLTNSDYDDIDPCYLPDGRIMFVSTRCRRVVLCHNAFTVSVLYRMDADGGNVECISANTVNDFTPSVMHDGRVAYTKWEYVDKQLGNNQSMWMVNPDGSSPQHLAGEHWGPITFWEPRAIPGSTKLVTTLAPHMPIAVGPIALIDPADACSSPAKYDSLTPEIPPPHHFGWHRPKMGYYCNPYPLSEDFHIVSYNYGPDDRDPKGYGLYLLDRWGNRDLIYRDPGTSCFEALPLAPRPRPAAIPDSGTPAGTDGIFNVLDIYQGLPGIARGSVKYLRVVQEIPKPVSAQCSGPWLQYPLMSWAGHLALKCLLGEVPVAPDGSASFRAPADTGLYFSALDANHQEIQRMRAMTHLRTGETKTCVGCHEPRTTAPPLRRAEAFRAATVAIAPPAGGPKAPDFYRDVQPVLTRNCVSCHSGPQAAAGLDLSPALTNRFNVAYESIMTKSLVSYVIANNSDTLPLRPPKYYGSFASKLMHALEATHGDRVQMTPDERRELVTWIDLNAPYYGTYLYSRPGTEGGRELLTPKVRGGLQAVYKQSCASCHQEDTGRVERVCFEDISKSPALLAPLPVSAGGTGKCGAVFTSRDDPGCQALQAALAVLAEEMRSNPREDLMAKRPPLVEANPRYVYRP